MYLPEIDQRNITKPYRFFNLAYWLAKIQKTDIMRRNFKIDFLCAG